MGEPTSQEQVLATIAGRLAGLRLRRGGLALGLWGEAGIGKTHAALALLRGAACRSLTVRATAPLAEVLLSLPRPRKPGAWLERSLDRLSADPDAEVGDGVSLLVSLLTLNAPFLLHVEDLHDANNERAAFWRALAARVAHARGVGLLVTSRHQPPGPFEAARQPPLDRAASDALLETEAGAPLPREALAWLWARAAGHPLFTLEYFRFLARRGFAWNDGHAWRWRTPEVPTVPIAVEALVERALAEGASTPDLEAALQARALLGPDVPEALWAGVAGLDAAELAATRTELARTGLLSGDDLAHPLYGEVLRRGIGSARQQVYARRALATLADDPRRAAPFVEGAGLPPGEALAWLLRAAQAARDADNGVQAARFEAKAAGYATGEVQRQLTFSAARGLRRSDFAESLRLAEWAATLDPQNAEVVFLLAHILASRGELAEAQRWLARLPASPETAAQSLVLHSLAGDHMGAVDLWHSQPDLRATRDPNVLCQVAFALSGAGQQTEASAVLRRALEQPDLSLEVRCKLLQVDAAIHYRLADYPRQEALTAEALTLARQGGVAFNVANSLYNRARALAELNRLPDARAALEEARGLYAEIGDVGNYLGVQVFLGDLLANAFGEYGQAEDLLLEARDLLRQQGALSLLSECEGVLTNLYAHWTVPHASTLALKHAQAALEAAHTLGNPVSELTALLALALAETGQGRAARGLEVASEALSRAQALGVPWVVVMATLQQGAALDGLGRRDEALACQRRAQVLAHEHGLSHETPLIALGLDRLLGDRAGVAAHLASFEAQGLGTLADQARAALRQLEGARPQAAASPHARLEVLGELRVVDGAGVRPVRGRRRQELLALLAEARLAGRPEVGRPDLLDALYPDTPEAQANAALRDLVHQVRAEVGSAAVLTSAGSYALGDLALDAETFLASGDTRLWRGPYLAGLSLATRQDSVQDALTLALRQRAETLLDSDPAEAARLGRLLLEHDPYDLTGLHLTLRALRAGGNHRGLGRAYARARDRLREVGEHLPERWADFLATEFGSTGALLFGVPDSSGASAR